MDTLATRARAQIDRDIRSPAGGSLGLSELSFVAHGKVFTIYRGRLGDGTDVGVRIVPERWMVVDSGVGNDGVVDPGGIVRQESLLSTHCRAHGIPAPMIFGRSVADSETPDLNLLVYEWLADDGAWIGAEILGRLLRQIHDLNPPAFEPIRQRGQSFETVMTRRTVNGLAILRRRSRQTFAVPDTTSLTAHLGWPDRRTSILHLGLKPGNLLAEQGQVTGVMGWCDAMIGPPTYELLSLDERGMLGDTFLGGYSGYERFHAPAPVETAFRLAAAVEIAVTRLDNDGDATEDRRALSRVAYLCDAFVRMAD